MTFEKLMIIVFCTTAFMLSNYEITNKMVSSFMCFGLGFVVFSVYRDLSKK